MQVQSKHETFINIASEVAKMSKCVSFQVGAVIVKDDRIISIGYNGTPAGYTNCCDVFPEYNPMTDREEHHRFSDKFEIHAEMNALLYASKEGISVKDATIYCTHQPCWQCSKNIAQSGIKKIIYLNPYDKIEEPALLYDFLEKNNVQYYRFQK
jgi:dCMP deaminase